jgi:hypothetical protein
VAMMRDAMSQRPALARWADAWAGPSSGRCWRWPWGRAWSGRGLSRPAPSGWWCRC